MRLFRTFLASLLCAIFGTSAFAVDTSFDTRKPANWANYPNVVRVFHSMLGNCTGQYVAPNLILTAAHCNPSNVAKKYDMVRYSAKEPQGQYCRNLEVIKRGDHGDSEHGDNDYMFLLIPEKLKEKCYNYDFLKLYNFANEKFVQVESVGFGGIRILNASDITQLRQILKTNDGIEAANELVEQWRMDSKVLKKDKCNVVYDFNCSQACSTGMPECNSICRNISIDSNNRDIKNSGATPSFPNVLFTTCITSVGNSGGPYIAKNRLLGITSYGNGSAKAIAGITDYTDYLASNVQFQQVLEELKQKYPAEAKNDVQSQVSSQVVTDATTIVPAGDDVQILAGSDIIPVNTNNGTISSDNNETLSEHEVLEFMPSLADVGNDTELSAEEIEQISTVFQKDRDEAWQGIKNAIDKTCIDDDRCVLWVANQLAVVNEYKDKITRLEKAYKKAKEREQSLANRTLTALTMAATGIGGMELAMGLAQQKADKAADADMEAYISTFQCKVADKRYKGGESGIELGGANQLTQMHQEYVNLAASLKERKAALGMKPGLEANVILDKATMGLYDNVGNGIEEGHFVSRYRASKGNEKDAKALQEEKDAAKKRVIAGGVIAGAGVVGGTIGNLAINGKNDNDDDETIAKDYVVADNDTVITDEDEEEIEESDELTNRMAKIDTRTPGCSINSSVSTIPDACKSHYASDTNEQARCNKCVNNAGTYEGGRCYVEVIGWACLGKGWPQDNKPNSPAPCATAANRYQDCHIVRKYVDAEKPFTCDPMTSIAPGKTALVSGCGQHGWSVGDKHPPFNLDGPNAVGQNCKLPLSSNMAWRKMYSKGSAIGVTFSGKTVTTGRWCMPSANSSPWNDSNHSGAAKHLLSSSLMAGGESKDKWFSLD